MFIASIVRRGGSFHRLLIVLLAFAVLAGATGRSAFAVTRDSRVLPQLLREAAANPARQFRVIVSRVDADRAADAALAVAGAKLKDLKADAFVATLPGARIAALGQHPAVKYIAPDAVMRLTGAVDPGSLATLYPAVVNATGLWSPSVGATPLTGAGIGIAVVDTGVNASLADFDAAAGGSRVVAQARFNAGTTGFDDGHGHGTHVAGIIAGNSWHRAEPSLQGKYIGIAPGANIVNVKVSDDAGVSYISDVVEAIEWVIANRYAHNIRVLNLSLVSSVAESYTTSVLAAAVERAWFNGILVTVAAGNTGPDTLQYPPANDPFVITVGAADPLGTPQAGDDGIAPWSSYGVTQDGTSKPEIAAPGRYIVAPAAKPDAVLAQQLPDRIVEGGAYLRMSGTSMAAPVVAGVAALAFQAHPEWSNDQVKWLLQQTATYLSGAAPAAQGAGELNAAAVVGFGGTPEFANQGVAISSQLTGPAGATMYDSATNWGATNWGATNWGATNWSATNWGATNWGATNWGTASWSSLPAEGRPVE